MTDPQPIDLHYEASGDGPPLVLLHGLYGSGNNWRSYARRWAADYRVLLPDLRNHGRSPRDPRMDYPAMAADIERLLEREGAEEATLLGHSMGGKVAMALALTRPARLRALVVADIAPVAYGGDEHAGIIAAMQAVDLAGIRSRRDADAELSEQIETPAVRQFLLTNLEQEDGSWRWRLPLGILAESLPAIQGWPGIDGHWEGPTLFVHGGRSPYVDAAGREAISRLFPQAEVETISNSGHWLHVEAPKAFTETVERFLREIPGR
ncbi:alpha/beta fold hydrolase [Arhodomonas sp. SL1]|uniref:alpha/beta fold hydrolase n=1 Tax=Arhodomonas sp. SL1 TaxID=3425691 RepID=UPI003F88192B